MAGVALMALGFYLLWRRCQVTTGAVFASAFMDDIFCLSRPYVSWQIPFHSSLGVCVVLGSAGALFAVHKHLLWHLHFGTRCQPRVYFDEMVVHAAPVDI